MTTNGNRWSGNGHRRKKTNLMTKQTPERLAKALLHEIAGVRSVLEQLRTELCFQVAIREDEKPEEVARRFSAKSKAAQKKHYEELCRELGFDEPYGLET
jgi:hypothetical protein